MNEKSVTQFRQGSKVLERVAPSSIQDWCTWEISKLIITAATGGTDPNSSSSSTYCLDSKRVWALNLRIITCCFMACSSRCGSCFNSRSTAYNTFSQRSSPSLSKEEISCLAREQSFLRGTGSVCNAILLTGRPKMESGVDEGLSLLVPTYTTGSWSTWSGLATGPFRCILLLPCLIIAQTCL